MNSFTLIFDYLFHKIKKVELRQALRELGCLDHLKYLENAYVIKNCKLFIYALTYNPNADPENYGVSKYLDSCKAYAKTLQLEGYCRPWKLKKLVRIEHELLPELKPFIGKFISRKMSFLIKSYGLTRHDLQHELILKGLQSLYQHYPFFESEKHIINVVKRAIHNHGIDIIYKYTRKKNNRLENKDGVFSQRNIDIEDCITLEAPTPFQSRYWEEKRTLDQLSLNLSKRGALFLSLARGEFNKDFSEYLGKDNRDATDNYKSYMKKVSKFLNLDNNQVNNFYKKLRKHLI